MIDPKSLILLLQMVLSLLANPNLSPDNQKQVLSLSNQVGVITSLYLESQINPPSIQPMGSEYPLYSMPSTTTTTNLIVEDDPNNPHRDPKILNFGIDEGGQTQVHLSWRTDTYTTTDIFFGLATGQYLDDATQYIISKIDSSKGSAIFGNLTKNTTYYYKITFTDNYGNQTKTDEQAFTTAP